MCSILRKKHPENIIPMYYKNALAYQSSFELDSNIKFNVWIWFGIIATLARYLRVHCCQSECGVCRGDTGKPRFGTSNIFRVHSFSDFGGSIHIPKHIEQGSLSENPYNLLVYLFVFHRFRSRRRARCVTLRQEYVETICMAPGRRWPPTRSSWSASVVAYPTFSTTSVCQSRL